MKPGIIYRYMQDGEENEVFHLVKSGFDKYVLPDVEEEGAKEFFSAARHMIFDRPVDHFIIVAESEAGIAGMIAVRNNNHICLFFVEKASQRKGIGAALLKHAIAACIARDPSVKEIDVNSSLFAVPIYKKLGFIQTKPEQFLNGIRFVPLSKFMKAMKDTLTNSSEESVERSMASPIYSGLQMRLWPGDPPGTVFVLPKRYMLWMCIRRG